MDEGASKVSMCMTHIYHVPVLASCACTCTFIPAIKAVFSIIFLSVPFFLFFLNHQIQLLERTLYVYDQL